MLATKKDFKKKGGKLAAKDKGGGEVGNKCNYFR
jgi:hypothetical protein